MIALVPPDKVYPPKSRTTVTPSFTVIPLFVVILPPSVTSPPDANASLSSFSVVTVVAAKAEIDMASANSITTKTIPRIFFVFFIFFSFSENFEMFVKSQQ